MNQSTSSSAGDPAHEVAALLGTLRRTGQRLEELTQGEVDSVADADGRTFLLRGVHQQLRDAEAARQASILSALPAHVALLDSRGTIVSVNEAWRRFATANAFHGAQFGIGSGYLEVCDQAATDVTSEAGRAAAGIRSVLEGTAAEFSLEYPCDSPQEQRWFLMTVTPLDHDPPDGAVVMHVDITARRRAEELLRASQKRLRDVFDGMGPAMFIGLLTPQGVLVEVNRSALAAGGLQPQDVLGRPFTDTPWWSHSPAAQLRLREAIAAAARGEPSRFDARVRGGSGEDIDIDFSLHPVRDETGEVVFLVPSGSVITERVQAREALQKSETEFRTLAEAMPQIVWIKLPDGTNIYFNPQWTQYTGLTTEQSRDGWGAPFHPEDRQSAIDVWALAAATGCSYTMESRLRRADGVYRWWLVRGTPHRDAAGAVVKWFGTCTDIHDMKVADLEIARVNGELRASEAGMKRLNRVHEVLSGINALIVRAGSREELFQEACRIAVEEGGFIMAMIARVDPVTKAIAMAASVGKDEELRAGVQDLLSSPERAATTMLAQAIRTRTAVVANESRSDERVLIGAKYRDCGVRSIAVLPLIVAGEAVGTLALYAGESEFFHADEMRLLGRLAGDVAFAVDHIERQERLDYLAYHDVLTGLANRRLFHERLEQNVTTARLQGGKVALVLVDVDRFKSVNDTLGRPAGDELLKAIAQRMGAVPGDPARLARIDADHFAIMMTDLQGAEEVARAIELRAARVFGKPFRIGEVELQVSIKIGVAMFPSDGADADTLFRNAEAALKNAKTRGEPYLFYAQAMNERVAEKFALESRLRRALDNEEFVLHYQPKVDLASGKVTGAEALIRWNDPRTGLVAPARFIPILEETGLIHEVGRWALRKAVQDHLRWRKAGLVPVRIAVNLSPRQLRDPGFIAELRKAVGVDPHAAAGLELEITEGVVMADVQQSIATLHAIRALGVTVAIDDFGTGFSSLSYLAKLPMDTLKIDRSFVVDMTASPEGLALVSTIITLAHSLRLNVVAEGVETEEQSRLLRLLGCDEMQGFLFSKPVASNAFEAQFLAPAPPPSTARLAA